ncbi:MAG TPA: hypothetical protein VK604_01365 [Bryobacteraceae bacterium]|nr:hypothetical protein [Bryobacteraceae bacterium]
MLSLICLILALVCFLVAAVNIPTPRVNLIALGLFWWVLSLLVGHVGLR